MQVFGDLPGLQPRPRSSRVQQGPVRLTCLHAHTRSCAVPLRAPQDATPKDPLAPSFRVVIMAHLYATLSHVLLLVAATLLLGALGRRESKARYTTTIRMEELGNCPELPNAVNGFASSEIVPWGKTYVGKGVLVFRRNYTRLTKAVAHIQKCNDRADPNCEPFQNWRFGEESCNLLLAKSMIWTPLFRFNPPLSCPIKANQYMLENVTVDLEKLKLIRFPEKGYYKISLMVDGDNIPKILCYHFEATFIRVRL